jgi:hypothetical protein
MGIVVRSRAGGASAVSLADIAAAHRLHPSVIEPFYRDLAGRSLVVAEAGMLAASPSGLEQLRLFTAALKQWLSEQLVDWEIPPESGEISAALDRIATRLVRDEASLPREAQLV